MTLTIPEITYSPLSTRISYKLKSKGNLVTAQSSSDEMLITEIITQEASLSIRINKTNQDDISRLLLVSMEYLFGHLKTIKTIEVNGPIPSSYPFNYFPTGKISREEFFQIPSLWHHLEKIDILPERWVETNNRHHPFRSSPYQGTVYKRYIPEISKTINFRLANIEKDLDTFHEWHNQPRVSCFWELNKSKEELNEYLQKGLKDPHQFPMIVEIDNEPVGYYEMYWVMEDRLGPYYDCEAWDRGFHFLIGNKKFLGYANTDAILNSGLHFMYLDDPRTRRVMAEPRHDNLKVLKYAEASKGWKKLKEFDFPHKRAALLESRREAFFGGDAL